MSRPIPVPSECFDMTPSELWPVYWEEYPHGTELPATVPKFVWDKQWLKRNQAMADVINPPAPPPLWKGYWGKMKGSALNSRMSKCKGKSSSHDETTELPPVYPHRLSKRFWERYFELFPDGHNATGYEPQPGRAAQQDPVKYKIVRGSLHVFDHGMWRPSTGVDQWTTDGYWSGRG